MPPGEAHEGSWASHPSVTQRKSTNENILINRPSSIISPMPDGNIAIYFQLFQQKSWQNQQISLDKSKLILYTNYIR